MLNLNLISQKDKDAFRFFRYRRAVFYMGTAAGAAMAVFIILLLPSFLFLSFQRKEILRELAVEEETLRALGVEKTEQRILALNATIGRVSVLTKDERGASHLLEELALLVKAVKLDAVKIDFSTNRIEIDGVAPTRNALLAFERILEDSNRITGVSVRLVDLVKLENVAFTLKGVLER